MAAFYAAFDYDVAYSVLQGCVMFSIQDAIMMSLFFDICSCSFQCLDANILFHYTWAIAAQYLLFCDRYEGAPIPKRAVSAALRPPLHRHCKPPRVERWPYDGL